MSFLKSLFGTKSASGTAISHATGASLSRFSGNAGIGQVGEWDYERSVHDGLERVTWVFRCVDVIAQKQSTLPIVMRKNYGHPDAPVVDDKLLNKLLNFRTNSYETAQQFRYRLSTTLLLSRRGAFIEVVRGRDGRPESLHLLPPSSTKPIPDSKTFVSGYVVDLAEGGMITLPPENVIWLKTKPHPSDPYQQLTPMMTTGLSIETDILARIFNRNYIANDGRPSMVVNVAGNINPVDLDEIKQRFERPQPGKTTVLNADGVTLDDMAASPRDVQWQELLNLSKEEILMAFGVPESVMGNASGRTFDNADAEREMFYVDTMVPHCDSIASGLDPLTGAFDDEVVPAYDYSAIAVLQRVAAKNRAEWRAEHAAGLRTTDEYRTKADLDAFNIPGTRILTANPTVAIAKDDDLDGLADYMVLGSGGGGGEGGAPMPMGGGGDQAAFNGAREGAEAGMRQVTNMMAARALELSRKSYAPRGRTSRRANRVETKSADSEDSEGERVDPVEQRLGEALDQFIEPFRKAMSARGVETKDFHDDWGIDSRIWRSEVRQALAKSIQREAMKEARMAAREMQEDGVLKAMDDAKKTVSKGRAIERVFGSRSSAVFAVDQVVESVMKVVDDSANAQFKRLEAKVEKMQSEGATKKQIRLEIRRMIGARSVWRKNLTVGMTTTAIEGARHKVYEKAGKFVRKQWNCQHDERTRPTHVKADGQLRRPQTAFRVGKARLQFPGDPSGLIEEIAGCRCWIEWKPTTKPEAPATPPVVEEPAVYKPSGKPVIRKNVMRRKKRKR